MRWLQPGETGSGSRAQPWLRQSVWAAVADELRGYRERGFSRLLTEDTVRFCTARALVAAGVNVLDLRVEVPHPALPGSRVDLMVGQGQPVAVIELKYPREPDTVNAPRTMVMGKVLNDFYRLAAYPGEVDRVFVYVETDTLRRHMAGAARRYGVDLDTDTVALRPADIARLPATAIGNIGRELASHDITAQRLGLVVVDSSLTLVVYRVDPLSTRVAEHVVDD